MSRRKPGSSRRQGAFTMVWLFFANMFEPAKAAATQQVADQRRIGADHLATTRAAAAPPSALPLSAPSPPARL